MRNFSHFLYSQFLLWLLQDRRVVALTTTTAAIESPSGAVVTYRRICRLAKLPRIGITSIIGKLFGADAAAPSDLTKLDGTTEAALARSLSELPAGERGWITFAEARTLFSTKSDQYAFGEADDAGRRNIESFAAQHRAVINFMPLEARVYFVRDPTAA